MTGPIIQRRNTDQTPYITDGGHYIYDCSFGAIDTPELLAQRLASIPGVVEHGLFIDLATAIFVAGAQGVRILGNAA
jgi:ribose 5-phosphate isomerase A